MAKRELIKSILDRVKKIFVEDKETQQEGNNDMNKKELILKTLEKMGYSPEVDNDGDIMLHYQMKTIYVMTSDEEEPYISMMLPQFQEIEDGQETLVLAVCNKMTRELKLAKVYVDQTFKSVTATCEFFHNDSVKVYHGTKHSLSYATQIPDDTTSRYKIYVRLATDNIPADSILVGLAEKVAALRELKLPTKTKGKEDMQ